MTYKLNYVKYRSPKNGGFWNAYAGAAFNDKGGEPPFAAACTKVSYARRSQLVDATHALKRSAGVSYPSVIRGRSLSCLATALSFA